MTSRGDGLSGRPKPDLAMAQVLPGNVINRTGNGAISLIGGDGLSDNERDQLLELCRHRTPISGSVKYRVLTRAKGRCECCGAGCGLANPTPAGPGGGPHRAQQPGRFDDLSNLQALCFYCNAAKRRHARGGLCVLRAGAHHRADGVASERTAMRS